MTAGTDGVRIVDTRTAGLSQVTAGYLLDAPRPTLIECGPALSVGAVLDALAQLGLGAGDLAYLVLSHIHLDHAGAAGDVVAAFPDVTVVVSELGAKHLADPGRLNASSRRVYGELMDTVYGDCTPVPADRILSVAGGEVLDLGAGRRLELFAAPGHAKHHIAALEPDLGALFVGDSVGVLLPGMTAVRPATPPPDFDLELAYATLARYRALQPATVNLAHYGPVPAPAALLAEAEDRLRLWAETAEAALAEHDELDHVAETLARRFADEQPPTGTDPDVSTASWPASAAPAAGPDAARRLDLLSDYRSNAAGLTRYFQTHRA